MIGRAAVLVILGLVAGCGVEGDPVAPEPRAFLAGPQAQISRMAA